MLNLAVARHAIVRPDQEAIVTGSERMTYEVLHRRVAGLASRMRELVVARGAIIPLVLDNDVDFVVALLATLSVGARPLPLAPSTTSQERETLLTGLDVPFALAGAAHAQALSCEPALSLVLPGPFRHEEESLEGPEDPFGELLLPTSGTTAVPRIARLSVGGICWNARAHARSVGLTASDRMLVVAPMYHSATLVAQVVASLLLGATMVLTRGPFMPRAFLKAIEFEAITATTLTPTHVRLILDKRSMKSPLIQQGDLSGLRLVTVGAAPIEPDVLRLFECELSQISDARVCVTYGLTEAGPRVSTLAHEDLYDRPESVGQVLPGIEIRVVDAGQRPLPPGSEGELQLRTPGRMIGYLGEEPEVDEWLATGDLAVVDEDGFITLRGRIKEIIVSGGVNVSPLEVERALCQDDRVSEAAVIGEPHEVLGEIVKAYVVPAEPVDVDEVLLTLSKRLGQPKMPRKLELVDTLPRTPNGKVDKRRLRAGWED